MTDCDNAWKDSYTWSADTWRFGTLICAEDAYRAYANQLNWRRPRHKIGWRNLTRAQKQQAILNTVLSGTHLIW